MAGSCECGNEPSGSINAGNLLTVELLASLMVLFHGVG